jgi:hypothetical protein
MKRYMKYALVLLTMLMALSIGVSFGENVPTVNRMMPSDVVNAANAGLNASGTDAADTYEKEAVDENETNEDNVIIESVNLSKTGKYIELKNNETSRQDLTGWKLEVQNQTIFTFPKFILDANVTVKVHAGTGNDSNTDLYTANSMPINADDEVSLRDANGAVVGTSEEPNETSDKPEDV